MAETALALSGQTQGELVAVQTVLDEDRWCRLRTGLRERGLAVHHVVLDVDPDVLRARIDGSDDAHEWRHQHVQTWAKARAWLLPAADTVVDTSALEPAAVAAAVLDGLARSWAGARPSPGRSDHQAPLCGGTVRTAGRATGAGDGGAGDGSRIVGRRPG